MEENRIVVVEDEREMAQLLVQALTESGFQCVSAFNGAEGLKVARNADLLLVDVMMPLMDGFTMVETLRKEGVRTPVIYLTAKDQTRDIVRGLEVGGDDYLIKPFKLEELIARIKAALRRSRDTSQVLQWHDLKLDTNSRNAFRGEHELFLSGTEFMLLELFLRQPEEVLSKRVILQKVWADDGYRDENIVELYINYLRKKTEARNCTRVIHTVRGKGYVLTNTEVEPQS